jgi:LysM repeat protein
LIEINTKSIYPTDPDRYAGIYQRIGGLHPGATYELTLHGELRGEGNEDDPHRFGAQWGISKEADWQTVDEWTTIDLGPISPRTQPVPLTQYKVRFEAPASGVVLFIRGWKKFAITNVEMDFNLDAISVRACDGKEAEHGQPWQGPSSRQEYPGVGGPVNQGPGYDGEPHYEREQGANCLYVVKPGDTLSQIAADHGVSMQEIIRANGIDDPSAIYVGQKFEIPGCNSRDGANRPEYRDDDRPQSEPPGPATRPDAEDRQSSQRWEESGPSQGYDRQATNDTYTVQYGDMLSWIAEEHGVNAYELAAYNGIDNMNFIYVGQVLVIPN